MDITTSKYKPLSYKGFQGFNSENNFELIPEGVIWEIYLQIQNMLNILDNCIQNRSRTERIKCKNSRKM